MQLSTTMDSAIVPTCELPHAPCKMQQWSQKHYPRRLETLVQNTVVQKSCDRET